MVDFSDINLPFNVGDLLSSSMSIVGLLGGFILLGLVLYFVPPIIGVIVGNFRHNKTYADVKKYQVKWYYGIEDHIKDKTIYRNK